ncbi:MAG: hypothetical protein IKS45_09525, partial [Thermoguttaceae bacterium]|nr:hypothetical protein [Thermoguttaceae bacterium]
MRDINSFPCRNDGALNESLRTIALFALLLTLISVLGLTVGCNTITPIDPTGEYMFRDASAPTCPSPAYSNGNCQTCPTPQRNTTTWLGSSRDPNSTIPQNSTPLFSPSKENAFLKLSAFFTYKSNSIYSAPPIAAKLPETKASKLL